MTTDQLFRAERIRPEWIDKARAAIAWCTQHHPDLSRYGFKPISKNAGWRAEPFDLACVATSLLFLKYGQVKVLRSTSSREIHSSYAWKHSAEQWGSVNGLAPYIANGDFAAASLYLQVPFERVPTSMNPLLGLKDTAKTPDRHRVVTLPRHEIGSSECVIEAVF